MIAELVRDVFEHPNEFRAQDAEPAFQLTARALNSLDAGGEVPIAIPVRRAGTTAWYVVSPIREVAEQVREELLAHVGITYTSFIGATAELEAADPIEARVARVAQTVDAPVFRIDVIEAAAEHLVTDALGRFLTAWSVRPLIVGEAPRAVSMVLLEFRESVLAGDEAQAAEALHELRTLGALQPLNLRYLEFEMLAAFGRFDELLDHPDLPHTLVLRRPVLVTDAIARAVVARFLSGWPTSTIDVLLERFSQVPQPFKALITTPGEVRSSAGALLLILHSSADDLDRAEEFQRWGTPWFSADEIRLLSMLEGEKLRPHRGDEFADISALLQLGRYDEALSGALVGPKTLETAEIVLRCASSLQTIDAAHSAIEFVETCGQDVQEALETSPWTGAHYLALRELAGADTRRVVGWIDFYSALSENPTWAGATAVAEQGSTEWDLRSLADDPDAISHLLRLFEECWDGVAATRTRQVLPHFLGAIDRVAADRGAFRPVELAALLRLALEEGGGPSLDLMTRLAISILEHGASASEYGEIVDALETRWNTVAAARRIAWAVDVVDVLLAYECPDPVRRRGLFSSIATSCMAFASRIDAGLLAVLRSLELELGDQGEMKAVIALLTEFRSVDSADSTEPAVARIGVYSLTEPVLRRAKLRLESMYPGTTVETNSDHGGTDRLRSMARNVDILIVAWQSAKHAATDVISAERPRSKVTEWAPGAGVGSIMTAVAKALLVRASR